MSSVSRIYGDPALGTDEVQQALRKANMTLSCYNVDRLIIKRFDDTYLASNINDPRAVDNIKQAIHSVSRVIVHGCWKLLIVSNVILMSLLWAVEPVCWLMPSVLMLTCAKIVSLWLRIRNSRWYSA